MLLLGRDQMVKERTRKVGANAWTDVSAKRPGLWLYDASGTLRRASEEEIEALAEAFPDYF